MKRQQIILIVGIVLGLLAMLMVYAYIGQQRALDRERARKELEQIRASQVSVLVAKRDIPQGGVIGQDSIEVQIIPNRYVQPKAATALDKVVGMKALANIAAGEQITLNKLTWSQDSFGGGGSLAMATPAGKRAITVSVDNINSLAGLIRPGDYVDVSAVLSIPEVQLGEEQVSGTKLVPLFQNVLILAVGQSLSSSAVVKDSSPLITLALSPEEANIIAFVQEQGKIRLVLRSPSDSQVETTTKAMDWDDLLKFVKPNLKDEDEDMIKEGYVEIYRGLKKERVPLYR